MSDVDDMIRRNLEHAENMRKLVLDFAILFDMLEHRRRILQAKWN